MEIGGMNQKAWAVGALSALMLIHSGRQALEVMSFLHNRDRIAAELCEQRSEPQSTCRGTCHLVKRVQSLDAPTTPISRTGAEVPVSKPREAFSSPVWREEGVTDGRWSWARLLRLWTAWVRGPQWAGI